MSTVSLVINGRPGVSEGVQRRVLRYLDYVKGMEEESQKISSATQRSPPTGP